MPKIVHPFDLQARAELAAQALTHLLDPQREGLIYFLADWRARPPRADHGLWDCGDGSGRHIDALALARSMVRPDSPAAVPDTGEAQLEAWMFRFLGEDGLSWLPHEPWAVPWGTDLVLADWQPGDVLAEVSWAQRGTLLGLSTRLAQSGDTRFLTAAQRMVDGLLSVAVRHADGLFFPEGYYRRGGWHSREPGLYGGIEEYNAAVLVPLVRFYQTTHYEPAIELAEGLARFALRHTRGYTPDGRLLAGKRPGVEDHLHTRTNFILGVLELGLEMARPEYVAWARQAYEHAKAWGTDFGWFPEGLGHRHGEICCTTDMIETALLLGRHVSRHYYAEAECFGRNHLLESQYLTLDQLRQAVEKLPPAAQAAPYEGRYSTTEGVTESQVGAFAARSTLNDAFHLDATAMMQCCNAAGTRGLYDLWHNAVEMGGENGHCAVHLRFSMQTPALKVVSYEPAGGRLDITTVSDGSVSVRLPAGERHALAVNHMDGAAQVQSLDAVDGYVRFDAKAGQCVELHYPLSERTTQYQVGAPGRTLHCTGSWRGETLMHIDPPGEYYPLYQRSTDLQPVQPAMK
ncbi:MAG: hypothetical protein M1546_01030 [Chloroflexi bacterium]|nr:hypothetical protein [Chloroflexota bacterium]